MPTTVNPAALRAARLKRGLSQSEVGRRAGISQPAISDHEHGKKSPSVPTLFALAKLYGVSVESLVRGPSVENAA